MDHTVSSSQYAVGENKRIHHAINIARDAIFAAKGGTIADLNFESAFDLLCMRWVLKVLAKKGCHREVINRIRRIYDDGFTIPMINNCPGRQI